MIQAVYFVASTTVVMLLASVSTFPSSAVGDTAIEQEIFWALLVRPGRSSVAVVDATPIPLVQPTASQWIWFGDSAAALRSEVESTVEITPDLFTIGSFPPSTHLVPRADLQPLRGGLETMPRWAVFRDRYGAREVFAFSRPVVTDDGLDALVYRVLTDGPGSGRTDLFWLHRAARSDAWSVAKELPISIS
jgi:hypothetical protein